MKKRDRAKRDAEYRRALGITDDSPIPKTLGTTTSAGSARGGRGSASKGRGRNS